MRKSLATFATYFVPEIPTLTVSPPVASRTASLIRRPSCPGVPNRCSVPVISRNASSSEIASTSGEKSANTSITILLISVYRLNRGGTTTACGHLRSASPIGIALPTPNGRAS